MEASHLAQEAALQKLGRPENPDGSPEQSTLLRVAARYGPCRSSAANIALGEARLTSHIAPFGREPGYRIFYCEKCHYFTWTRWPGSFRQQQQQQQQQQSQPLTKKGQVAKPQLGSRPVRGSPV
jgi:hypothetical protein